MEGVVTAPCGCTWRPTAWKSALLIKECAACAAKDPFDGLTEEDQTNE